MILRHLFPRYSLRYVIASKLSRSLRGHSTINPFFNLSNLWDRQNLKIFAKYSFHRIECCVCGKSSNILYDFPNIKHRSDHRIGLLRESLQCKSCGATMRDRTLAYALLRTLNQSRTTPLKSIADYAASISSPILRILDTDAFGPISRLLMHHPNYLNSSYIPDAVFGIALNTKHFNINLEKISFDSSSFDILLSSDVAEHIRDIDAAHREIFRVLRPGGAYIFTVPYDPDCPTHHLLVDTSTSEDKPIEPFQYHGDPLTGGILAYRVFGQQIFQDLEEIGFKVEFLDINMPQAGIYGGDIFIARKQISLT